jgi:ketosteroid isomerase-like protein
MTTLYCLPFAASMALASPPPAEAAKPDAVEQEIRRLDQAEAAALLRKDVATLEKLWAEDFTVNNPRNSISDGRSAVLTLFGNGTIDYASVVRETEKVLVHGDTVITMGQETIKPVGKAPFAGLTVRRRYTHFWMKRDGQWRLRARHANAVCQDVVNAAPTAGRD